MAYLERIDSNGAQTLNFPPFAAPIVRSADFTPLEWSIIRYARLDRLWTVRPFGPLRRFWNWWGGRANPKLANDRLEALRTAAVLSRHFSFTVPSEDVAAFLAAGFTTDQYELLVSSVREAPRPRAGPSSTEAFA